MIECRLPSGRPDLQPGLALMPAHKAKKASMPPADNIVRAVKCVLKSVKDGAAPIHKDDISTGLRGAAAPALALVFIIE